MSRALCALFCTFPLIAGCACDVVAWAERRAGDSAVDCGEAPLGELQDDYHECAVDAYRRGDAFFVVFENQGIDSRTRTAWASNGEFVWFATYDGDPSGGDGARAEIYENGCADTDVRTGSGRLWVSPDQEVLACDVAFREKVCP